MIRRPIAYVLPFRPLSASPDPLGPLDTILRWETIGRKLHGGSVLRRRFLAMVADRAFLARRILRGRPRIS